MLQIPIHSGRKISDFLAPALDSASIIASMAMIRWLAGDRVDETASLTALVAAIAFLLAGQLTPSGRRSDIGSADREMTTLAITWLVTILIMSVLGFLTRGTEWFARSTILAWLLLAPAMIGMGRMCLRILHQGLMRRGIGIRRVAIAGHNQLGMQTAENISADPGLGLQFVGFYDDRERRRDNIESENFDKDSSDAKVQDAPLRGNLAALIAGAKEGKFDTVMVTLPMRAEARIRTLLDELSDSTASVYIVPDFFVFELLHSRWTNVGGLPAVSIFENPLFGVDGILKRVTDLFIALFALVLSAIPMTLIAIIIKLTSKGPVFFRQKRYGLDGREILVWKFRSMRTCDNGPVVKQATKDDPRITRIGAILRKTSLDELPQLFNVLAGNMSLVGPRPHASAHNELYRGQIRGYMMRHKVKPGITGLAQVNGCRGETETVDKMEKRVQWDHHYIRSWSLWLDIKILFRTLLVAWRQEEAY
jgi:putative colanic acid biosysnthesis UDP-glucose lipid carrier transferase